ncbi:MAG TPA: peptidylprolyl isomerase [Draconibacterium sp.]|nr:peptidylprolyl isomerase [Draconibacterium sp.]
MKTEIYKAMKLTGLFLITALFAITSTAQDKVVDQIVALVGGNIILKSDIERMHIEQQAQGVTTEGDMKCEILENFLVDKLLVAEAELDTLIEVTPSQVNQRMDQQLAMYVSYIGSEKAVEEYFKKSIVEIKSEMREGIRNQLLSQQMREKIVQDVTVTPSEVRYNFRNLKDDEIPTIPTQYEYAQITFQPVIDLEEDNRIKSRLRDIKKRIEDGSSFATMAVLYSECPSAKDGGVIGYSGRAELDPAYAAVAFNLKDDRISNVVRSAFGYHIVQLVDKKGDKVNTRHVLMKPKISVEAKEVAYNRLDSLAKMIRNNEIAFEEAAQIFSYDKNTRNNSGIVINPNSMSSKFSVEELDPDVSKIITKMNVNEISVPFESIDRETQLPVFKIIKVLKKIDSHKADLQNDYQKLAEMYLMKNKEGVFNDWISKQQSATYIRIDATYANCNFNFNNWIK